MDTKLESPSTKTGGSTKVDVNLNAGQIVDPKLDGKNAQKVWNFSTGHFYHSDRPLLFFCAVHFGPDFLL